MRFAWFSIFLAVVGTVLVAGAFTNNGNTAFPRATARKLKEDGVTSGYEDGHDGDFSLEDYRPVDPSPSSKAVRPGPIQHGTPLIPYIPRPVPPSSPRYGSYP